MRRGGIVKILQYCQKVGRFPLHNDEPRDKRLFRISASLADGIPDFAMCFDGSRRTYVMARGFMTMIVMDMHAAGRLHDPPGEGLIKHQARHRTHARQRPAVPSLFLTSRQA
jgi:hypothetical protein